MALDNIEARSYINKMGIIFDIPILDAGTGGFQG